MPRRELSTRNTANIQFIERRQRDLCSSTCASTVSCSARALNPAPTGDCESLVAYVSYRGYIQTVPSGSSLTVGWGSCEFTFTNTGAGDAIWCDSNWSSQSGLLSKNCIEKGYSKANCANDFMTLLVSRRISSGILVTTPTDTPTGQPITSSTRATESSAPESSSTASISSSSRFISNSTLTGQTSLLSLSTHISAPTSVPLSGVSQFSESELPPTASVSSIQGSSNSDHSTGDGRHGLSAAVIAGIVAGIIVALLIILVLWMLQRRRRRSNTLKPATAPGLNSGSMLVLIQTSVSHSGISTPAAQGGEQQFGTQSSSRPTYDALPSGDWSARSLARALVPHLSEGDIDRLADSIVT
ncbi:hypothetical protein FRC20_007157, partial [Serendipita sp. 405]